jgi:hypothetical protein
MMSDLYTKPFDVECQQQDFGAGLPKLLKTFSEPRAETPSTVLPDAVVSVA